MHPRNVSVGLLTLALGSIAACENPAPVVDAGVAVDGRAPDAARDGGGDADLDAPETDAGPAVWATRSCDVTIRWAGGGASVAVAGDFSGWTPRAMRDDDGDGAFELTLSSGDGLRPGELHAYKLIVDGTWILDPSAAYRKYDGGCLNSAFLAPDCSAGPELVGTPVTTHFDATSSTGSAEARVLVRAAADGVAPTNVTFTLDGAPVTGRLDAAGGAYDLALTGLAEGRHVLAARATDAASRDAEPIDLPFWIEAEPFSWRDATMYMIVVDRFANGDTSIDAPVGAPVQRPADFHGGDLGGVLEVMRSGYFEELGVNVLWLSPINQQAEGHFPGRDDGNEYAGYHGYWPTRGSSVEPRFGGDAALRALVDEAHRRGIRVLFDLINNQIHERHEYFTAHPEWFRTGCVCGASAGCGWSERPLDCLFAPYLPDIDWRVPEAEAQFIDDAVSWVEDYGVDGFRIDAVKHVETNSIADLRATLHRRFEQGGTRLFLVGETAVGEFDAIDLGCGQSYSNGYEWIDDYVGEGALDGQFDFPSNHRMEYGLVTGSMGYTELDRIVSDMATRYRPEGLHVRFLGTHDSNRIASRAASDPAVDCRWPGGGVCASLAATPTDPAVFARVARAFTALYTMPGIPFLYYGDELGMAGGNDPDNRRDMIWQGPLAPLAMSGTTLAPEQLALRAHLASLGHARASSTALRRGRRVPLVVEDDLYVNAWTDELGDQVALVVLRRGGAVTARTIDGLVPTLRGSATRLELVAGQGTATLSGSRITLSVPSDGSAIFVGR